MDSHSDEINEMKLLNRRNKTMKHVIAKQKIDQTGNTDDGYSLLRQLENAEDKSLSGSGIDRKIGTGRKKKVLETITETPSKSTRAKTEWQILVNKTMNEQGLGLKDTLKYIKEHNLYKKKGSGTVFGKNKVHEIPKSIPTAVERANIKQIQDNEELKAARRKDRLRQKDKVKKQIVIDSDDILPGFIA
jgi:hypothetical protein